MEVSTLIVTLGVVIINVAGKCNVPGRQTYYIDGQIFVLNPEIDDRQSCADLAKQQMPMRPPQIRRRSGFHNKRLPLPSDSLGRNNESPARQYYYDKQSEDTDDDKEE